MTVTDSISGVSLSGVLWRVKRYAPSRVPSASACTQASGSMPPMPAPWAIVATDLMPGLRRSRATFAATFLIASKSKSAGFPNPATSTRGEGILPSVWISVSSPVLPRMSPCLMSAEIAPPMAASTAPVAPPGVVTPSKRLTTIASAVDFAMSPLETENCTSLFPHARVCYLDGTWSLPTGRTGAKATRPCKRTPIRQWQRHRPPRSNVTRQPRGG